MDSLWFCQVPFRRVWEPRCTSLPHNKKNDFPLIYLFFFLWCDKQRFGRRLGREEPWKLFFVFWFLRRMLKRDKTLLFHFVSFGFWCFFVIASSFLFLFSDLLGPRLLYTCHVMFWVCVCVLCDHLQGHKNLGLLHHWSCVLDNWDPHEQKRSFCFVSCKQTKKTFPTFRMKVVFSRVPHRPITVFVLQDHTG